MSIQTQAIVARAPESLTSGPSWTLEQVEVGKPGKGQVLVRMIASGICHTDILMTSLPEGAMEMHYPKVVGHEGAGYVEAVGDGVTKVQSGDPVLLSFDSCGSCSDCSTAHSAYCNEFDARNYVGSTQSWSMGGKQVYGSFFGQSSFSKLSVVSEASIVNAKGLIEGDEELKLFAPLGCGLQTGSGALVNIAKAGPQDTVLVLGLGTVGLASIMTAKILNCKTIIGVDRDGSRLKVAESVGATALLNTTDKDFALEQEVRKMVKHGVSVVIDTTGAPELIEAALSGIAARGKMIMIGIPPFEFEVKKNGIELIKSGVSIMGCIEGDCDPQKYVPQMVQWYRDGLFPIDKIVSYMPVEKFADGLAGMHAGHIIKPVLLF